jgi:hypothetical protein
MHGLLAIAAIVASIAMLRGPIPASEPAGRVRVQKPGPFKLPAFPSWPKETKPDAVIVISGQTYGYLQPCGCSQPQLGGLERRANLISTFKAAGWPVVSVDLGDLPPAAGVVPEQVLLKYKTTILALHEMGYLAVGAGRAEFTNGLYRVLDQFAAIQSQPPFMLAGNVGGLVAGKITARAEAFSGPGNKPRVGLVEIAEVGSTPIGVVGVVGSKVAQAVDVLGPKTLVGFTDPNSALNLATKELAQHPRKPRLNILLDQGSLEEAKALVKLWPQFSVLVCLSSDSEPSEEPVRIVGPSGQETLLVQVGYKGRYVGVVGAFKKSDGSFDLRYQLVPLGEEYVTPGDEGAARKTNPVLTLLDDYAAEVKSKNFLGKFPQGLHPNQAKLPQANLQFVGSAACATCHAAEHATWQGTLHSHALDSLEKGAKRPALRNFDGECVVCHTTGFGYKTGYRDERTTPALKHVGCESCHGPGSGHAADPKDARLLALQSPWRQDRTSRLPDIATLELLGKLGRGPREERLTPVQQAVLAGVSRACAACHDTENDPRFDLFTYWPKIAHGAKK